MILRANFRYNEKIDAASLDTQFDRCYTRCFRTRTSERSVNEVSWLSEMKKRKTTPV